MHSSNQRKVSISKNQKCASLELVRIQHQLNVLIVGQLVQPLNLELIHTGVQSLVIVPDLMANCHFQDLSETDRQKSQSEFYLLEAKWAISQ